MLIEYFKRVMDREQNNIFMKFSNFYATEHFKESPVFHERNKKFNIN
jgi:hypothetical protein